MESRDYSEGFSSVIRSARPERLESGCPPGGLEKILARRRRRVRSRRRRTATVGALILVLVPILLQTNVVSNVLEFVEVEGPEWVGRIFKSRDGALAFNVLGDHTDEEINEYGQKILADEGTAVSAEGFVLQGKPVWFVIRVYQAFGGDMKSGRRSTDPPTEYSDTYREFIRNDWEGYLDRIESGSLKPVGSELVELDGHSFLMKVWELDHPELGTVRYFAGDVVAAEDPGQEE